MFVVGRDPWGEDGPGARALEYRDNGNRRLSVGGLLAIGPRLYAYGELGWDPIPASALPGPSGRPRGSTRVRIIPTAAANREGR